MEGRLHTWTGMVPLHRRTRVAELLQDALGGAAAAAARDLVASRPAVVLGIDDEPVAAAIGRETEGGGFVIEAIAVERALRGSGLGRRLLEEVSRVGGRRWIEAETDRDSVEFYRRCGFAITSLGEKYPGVERFRCERVLPEPRCRS